MLGREPDSSRPVCTIRRHPEGGYTPVLHLSQRPVPQPRRDDISLPTPEDVARYARNHFGTVAFRIHEECSRAQVARAG